MLRVCVVGPDFAVARMFLSRGWEVQYEVGDDTDLIQFTGGADVSPSYYGESKHPYTSTNPTRDAQESEIFQNWVGKKPMAGICRGGQLLNVLSGGAMWQHVNGHAVRGTHPANCLVTDQIYEVSSTHHQMMRPNEGTNFELWLWASEASTKENYEGPQAYSDKDAECLFYPETRSLCFQPHPEYFTPNHECQTLYFKYLQIAMNRR
jgi:carbamoylphosphate synthase small subunit